MSDQNNRATQEVIAKEDSISQLKEDIKNRVRANKPGATQEVKASDADDSQDNQRSSTDAGTNQTEEAPTPYLDGEYVSNKDESFQMATCTLPVEIDGSYEQISPIDGKFVDEEENIQKGWSRRNLLCIGGFCCAFTFIILIIVLSVLLIGKKNEEELIEELQSAPSSSPSLSPTSVPSSSPTRLVQTVLTPILVSFFGEDYVTYQTASQYAAREWMEEDLTNNGSLQDNTEPSEIEQQKMIERYISSLLYFSFGGENWNEQLNFLSDGDVCSWNDGEKGLFCEDGTIKQILMESNALSDEIPSEIGALSDLELIDLSKNKIKGTLPDSIGNLENLQTLEMGGNRIGGTIPSQIGNLTSIVTFSLSNNDFVGSIPSEIGNLVNAQEVALSQEKLIGTIPSQFGNLKELTKCYLQDNKLTGTVPPELLSLPNLLILRVERNDLTGSIEVCGIPNLGADCKGKKGEGENVEVKCHYTCCSYCCDREENCNVNNP